MLSLLMLLLLLLLQLLCLCLCLLLLLLLLMLVVSKSLWVLRGSLQWPSEILVTGPKGRCGLNGSGHGVVSLGLRPGDSVDELGRSLAGLSVRHGSASIQRVQLMQLCLGLGGLVVKIDGLGCAREVLARRRAVEMRWRKLLDLRNSTEILNKGVVGG